MKIISLSIPDVKKIEPTIFSDDRGYFFEQFNEKKFTEMTGQKIYFSQDNQSFSKKGVLRGLHYQLVYPQAKLVRVTQGVVFDVAVDLRKNSLHFGQWVGEILSAENNHQLLIPEGFAHGFLVLSDGATFQYKVSDAWYPEHERCIVFDDKDLNIQWPEITCDKTGEILSYCLSEKDKQGKHFFEADIFERQFTSEVQFYS
jgi:dTDP-4-dehydrorhamnose 3,5-epimerase